MANTRSHNLQLSPTALATSALTKKEISVQKANFVKEGIKLKQELEEKLDLQKMMSLAEVGSHVVAGALAAAHASASLSQSEVTSIDG